MGKTVARGLGEYCGYATSQKTEISLRKDDKQGLGHRLRGKVIVIAAVSCLAATSGTFYIDLGKKSDIPSDFYTWTQHEPVATAISANHPELINDLARQAHSYHFTGAPTEQFPSYKGFTKENLLDLLKQNYKGMQAGESSARYIMLNKSSEFGGYSTNMAADSFYLTLELLRDKDYTKTFIKGAAIDCKVGSITYFSACAAEAATRGGKFEVELVTGVAYSKEILGSGGAGHQWIRIGNDIVDPLMEPELGFRLNPTNISYVPIVGMKFVIDGTHVVADTQIYCYPSEIETNYANSKDSIASLK